MNNQKPIYEYPNGIAIWNIIGRGIVIAFPQSDINGGGALYRQRVGDKWIFDFGYEYAPKIVEVKGVEIANSFINSSPYGLCFGGQFNDNDIKLMRLGQVKFRKIIENI